MTYYEMFNCILFCPSRATIEEVEGDVCELESKLDKVSISRKCCTIVHLPHCCAVIVWDAPC